MTWWGAFAIAGVMLMGTFTSIAVPRDGLSLRGPPDPLNHVVVPVSSGTSVTIFERTTDLNELLFDVPTLMGPGGSFTSLASEVYTFTSDGTNLIIDCFRNAMGTGSNTGHNIAAARLNGVTGSPSGLWASLIVNYSMGHGGIESARFNALGDNVLDHTYMGDQASRLVLAFTAPHGQPVITSFTATAGIEGGPVQFSAAATDPDGDAITYSFDFQDDGTYDQVGPQASASFIWGDDHVGTARLRVSDGVAGAEQTAVVTVANVPPAVSMIVSPATEGSALAIQFTASDPGSDDLLVTLDWADGASDTRLFMAGGAPDTPESTDVNPRTVTDLLSHIYGDDGTLSGTLSITDDDGGADSFAMLLAIVNVDPGSLLLAISCTTLLVPMERTGASGCKEGDTVGIAATITDPGSDDLTFAWDFGDGSTESRTSFNDGLGADADASFGGVFPFTAGDTGTHVWGDDGMYPVELTVTDDDLGLLSTRINVTITNVAPTVELGLDAAAYPESGLATALASFHDPGSDDVTLSWSWELGPSAIRTILNDGAGPDPPLSPDGTFPFSGTDTMAHRYGDNGAFQLTVTATDDDGGSTSTTVDVVVENVAPTIDDVQVYAAADITLRVAGEKFHDVCLEVVDFGSVTAGACVVRMPGSPDRQSATITGGRLQLLGDTHIALYYTPDDDPINGQRNGDNPVWVILAFADGSEVRLHHNFNVQHPGTWIWTLDDLAVLLVGKPVTFEVTASDVGSDDLRFDFDFGDGTTASVDAFWDGIAPDPARSPDFGGMHYIAGVTHAFASPGGYATTVTVTDDDGGMTTRSVLITVG